MGTGLVLAAGTTRLWFLADLFLILIVLWRGRREFHSHWTVTSLAGIIGVTALWSPDPLAAILTAWRIIALYSLVYSFRLTRQAKFGVGLVLVLQLAVTLTQLDQHRLFGLSFNASNMGQAGLVFMAWPGIGPFAALTLGLSTARSAALALVIYTVLRRSRYVWTWAIVAALIFVGVTLWQSPERISPAGIEKAVSMRSDLDAGVPSLENITGEVELACGRPRPRSWQVLGYGYHGYCVSTGLQRPHNFWILSFYDLGVLFFPFWAVLFIAAWRLKHPMIPALLALGLITEELFARPEGVYLIAIALASLKRPHTVDSKGDHVHQADGDQAGGDVVNAEPVDQDEQQNGLNAAGASADQGIPHEPVTR